MAIYKLFIKMKYLKITLKKNHTWIVLCQRRFIVYSPCGRVNKGRDCVEKDGVHVMSSAETVLKNKAESLL